MDFQPMSPDEIERTVQFLLQQQARFDADLSASQARFDARIDRLAAKTEQVTDGLIGLTAIVGRLVEAQGRTDEQLRATGEQMRATDQQLRATDVRVSQLTERLGRHLNDDHGDVS